MDRARVTAAVKEAMRRVVEEQTTLLDLDVTERALSHFLAIYLAEFLPSDLDVDVEYNRHGETPKRLQLPMRDATDRELRATTVFPDILVHKRNTDEHNLVVLEVKKPGEPREYDELKLRAFRLELAYAHAGHVILGRASDGSFVQELIWVDD